METQFFYLFLVPTDSANPYHYSDVFPISFSSSTDLKNQLDSKSKDFMNDIGIAKGYNSESSTGYVVKKDADDARISDIATKNNVVKDNWPISIK